MTASPIDATEAARLRSQIPAATAATWLNTGMVGPMPQVAIDAMAAEHHTDAHVRQTPDHWERLVEAQTLARGAITSLTGVGPDQAALMHSTHEGINTCVWGLDLQAGDSIVTTDEEHPGVLVPLRIVRERLGCVMRVAPWRHDEADFVGGVLEHVDGSTRAVVLSHVSWMTGRSAPIRALRAALPPGCRIIVDGAQSAGVLGIDPTDGWDAYTVSGQKWPLGPNGTGGLALIDPEAWLPTFGAFAQVSDYADCLGSPLVADGRRFETSQESIAPLTGFAASVHWLVSEAGLWRAHAHARTLNGAARAQLTAALALEPTALSGDAHLLCVELAGRAVEVAAALHEQGIIVRSLGPDRLRLSFGAWNDETEISSCVSAITQALHP